MTSTKVGKPKTTKHQKEILVALLNGDPIPGNGGLSEINSLSALCKRGLVFILGGKPVNCFTLCNRALLALTDLGTELAIDASFNNRHED